MCAARREKSPPYTALTTCFCSLDCIPLRFWRGERPLWGRLVFVAAKVFHPFGMGVVVGWLTPLGSFLRSVNTK